MTINLLEVLNQEDKIRIENYIKLYGTCDGFIGVDEWLQSWAKNNFKLYHFLGDQLIYKIPYCYEKPAAAFKKELEIFKDGIKFSPFFDFCNNDLFVSEGLYSLVYDFVSKCLNYNSLERDAASYNIKIKLPGKRKTFQIQGEAKPLRSLAKFLNYCRDCGDQKFQDMAKELIEVIDDLIVRYSQIFNDKMLRGNLVLSIHPLDFMTMSDNSLNWQSCMNWVHGGCYRVGTIEMMNSNNVVCCYLESSKEPFSFGEDKNNPLYQWSNKKWRQLIYLTKDIIVTGKPYPYVNEELSKQILNIARELAEKNLHWTYSFGPELYQDMKYINSTFSMERAKRFIRLNNMKKHNIIFDTKGMYNDMLNDNSTHYWCIRNKVSHNKVISYSGKAPCLCCGGSILQSNDEYSDDYNDRYYSTTDVICLTCLDNMRCTLCGCSDPRSPRKIIYGQKGNPEVKICEECEEHYFFKCPCCGKTFFFSDLYDAYRTTIANKYGGDHISAFVRIAEEIDYQECHPRYITMKADKVLEDNALKTVIPIFMCNDCLSKDDRFELTQVEIPYLWGSGKYQRIVFLSKKVYDPSDWDAKYTEAVPAKLSENDFLTG